MTEQIYSDNARKIMQNKKQIEESLKIGLENKSGIITVEGNPADEITAVQVIEAVNLGFSISQALDLKNEDFVFEKIPIKNFTKRKDLSQIRARIIGTKRKVLRNIEYLTGCEIVLHDNLVGIIGWVNDVKKASYAIKKIIAGSKHANVYMWLEQQRAIESGGF